MSVETLALITPKDGYREIVVIFTVFTIYKGNYSFFSSLIFPLKQFSMHITTGSYQAIAIKGHAFATKITQKVHIIHT